VCAAHQLGDSRIDSDEYDQVFGLGRIDFPEMGLLLPLEVLAARLVPLQRILCVVDLDHQGEEGKIHGGGRDCDSR
jgi:hypothetical protein